MNVIEYLPAASFASSRRIVGTWYLRGFADAYGARWAVAPTGPEADEYLRGYALGVARVREEFFAALVTSTARRASVPADACCE